MIRRLLLSLSGLTAAFCVPSAQALAAQAPTPALGLGPGVVPAELAGRSLAEFPWFAHGLAFNEGATVQVGVDTRSHPALAGESFPLWVVAHQSPQGWTENPVLVDARGAPQTVVLQPGGYAANVFTVDAGRLDGGTGTTVLGVGYDVVLDRDADGTLSSGDWIDGWGRDPGFALVQDLTLPGPYTTVEEIFIGSGTFERLDVYWPEEIATLGRLPIVIVSHGNGHNFKWYDHIGNFLSSWGYVVVSHKNNTGPGVTEASKTTLSNTDFFLKSLDAIGGGALVDHVDQHRISWFGHSRGGEGVVIAYRRLADLDPVATALATRYTAEDIRLVSSIAPTDFKGALNGPRDVPYHLWTGGADADVNGCANCNLCQTFHLFERAEGERMSISLHGVGHGDFHDGGGSSVAAGPCRVGRSDTHRIMRGVLLPLLAYVLEDNQACKQYLWRQWEELRPIGAPDLNPCVVVDLQYQEAPAARGFVVDSFQERFDPSTSSSGGRVSWSMDRLVEGLLDDGNTSFSSDASDPMNGMTLAGPGDTSRGVVFHWDRTEEWLLFELASFPIDLRQYAYLSFRAAQSTRDPLTDAEPIADLTFSVRVWDIAGDSSTIHIGAYGGGIEEPYRRDGCGSGEGWANEFETIRIPLEDFRANGTRVDLGNAVALEFLFGPPWGSPEGRIGLDEIEFTAR